MQNHVYTKLSCVHKVSYTHHILRDFHICFKWQVSVIKIQASFFVGVQPVKHLHILNLGQRIGLGVLEQKVGHDLALLLIGLRVPSDLLPQHTTLRGGKVRSLGIDHSNI